MARDEVSRRRRTGRQPYIDIEPPPTGSPVDALVPDPLVARELGISSMTLWRWDHKPEHTPLGWQSLSARAVRAGGLGGAHQGEELGALWAQALDRGGQEAAPSQRVGDRARQQARPHRLGGAGQRTPVRNEQDQ